jgi:UDP-2-acetamido-2,6-beta-L-arabino-hexul-4-ose reductase
MKIKIGITGQDGFIGKHLYNYLGLITEKFERIYFERDFFLDEGKLKNFVSQCDVIVHLAAMNRNPDPQVIYDTNIDLVKKITSQLFDTKSKAHVLFASSTQEEGESLYGKSKKDGREIFANWAIKSGGKFSGLLIPNVFGPFGKPFHNSFITTFCYQLCVGERPAIKQDSSVRLIYIDQLVKLITEELLKGESKEFVKIKHADEATVSEILDKLTTFKLQYFDEGVIPKLNSTFDLNLFNTFRSYIARKKYFPVKFNKHSDSRGSFIELIRANTSGQISFSTTVPGVTRGNHFHTRKIERFAVLKGKALIQLRKIGSTEVEDFYLNGDEPAFVDMPVWFTHNITNIGDDPLYTVFWISEFFDASDPDTFFETVNF